MKRLSKPLSIVIALLILLFTVLSVHGFAYYEGDLRKSVIKGYRDLDWGIDVNGGARIVMSAATEDEVSDEECVDNLYKSADIIEKRIAAFGLADSNLYVNEEDRQIVLEVPNNNGCELSAREVAIYLTCTGELRVCPPATGVKDGYIDTSFVYMYTDSERKYISAALTDSEDIIRAEASLAQYTTDDGEEVEYDSVFLQFTTEAADTIYAAKNGVYFNQDLSVWLDDIMLTSKLDGDSSSGYLFTGNGFTEGKSKLYAAIISNGTLPSILKLTDATDVAPVVAENSSRIVVFAGLAAIVLIALVLLLKYKFAGFVGLLATLLQFSLVFAVITGFCFNKDEGTFLMTLPAMAGLVTSVLLTVLSVSVACEKIKSKLNHGTLAFDAIDLTAGKSRRLIADITFITAIVSLMGMFMFGGAEFVRTLLAGGITGGIYSFCYVLFFGSLMNFITGWFIALFMMKGFARFKCLNKDTLFGGAKK